MNSRKAFTLIELLVVIAIVAVIAVVVALVLNPAELLRQSRDSTRLSDLSTLNRAISLYEADRAGSAGFSLGTSSIIYLSIPDPTASSTNGTDCTGLGLGGGSFHCPSPSAYKKTDGTGWIPINFAMFSGGSPLSSLPVDPVNQSSTKLYYCYVTDGRNFTLVAGPESQKYVAQAVGNPSLYSQGSSQTIGGCPNALGFSDSFTGADGTPLATHNSAWVDVDASFPVANLQLPNNTVWGIGPWVDGGALHSASIADTSQIVIKASLYDQNKYVCVRATAGSSHGYCANFNGVNGFTISKAGSFLTTIIAPFNTAVDHTIAISASGQNTVTLSVSVDGTVIGAATDSGATITGGHPAFMVAGDGTQADSAFGPWQD